MHLLKPQHQRPALGGGSARRSQAAARKATLPPPTSASPRAPAAVATRAASSSSSSPPRRRKPRRAVVILPGLGNAAEDYAPLADLLRAAGAAHVSVAPVERWNWALNALALRDPRWWQGCLPPRPAVDWYVRRIEEAVEEAAAALAADGDGDAEGPGRLTLLSHSAGGWIGRVYLRDYRRSRQEEEREGAAPSSSSAAASLIDRFVSLGSPHRAPPKGVEGVVDQTRGILTWVEDNCPGAHLHDEGVRYVTIAGRLVQGLALGTAEEEEEEKAAAAAAKEKEQSDGPLGRVARLVAGVGYQQVCGAADSHGDFIVPVEAAHLGDPRAVELDIDGVFHSPLGEQLRWPSLFGGGGGGGKGEGAGGKGEGRAVLPPWYGHPDVAPAWIEYAVGEEEALPEPGRRLRVSVGSASDK
jgi:hypothetical protein